MIVLLFLETKKFQYKVFLVLFPSHVLSKVVKKLCVFQSLPRLPSFDGRFMTVFYMIKLPSRDFPSPDLRGPRCLPPSLHVPTFIVISFSHLSRYLEGLTRHVDVGPLVLRSPMVSSKGSFTIIPRLYL